ncbi:MAG TPA: hypothetical protein VFP63_01825 [Dehalococcoidia bacterium]|nr:hypothetical protein [Dehalococcoidia bacterium]
MMDFAGSDLSMESVAAQREREARVASRFAEPTAHRGLRGALAARLARLAFRLDAEAIKALITPDARIARRHG